MLCEMVSFPIILSLSLKRFFSMEFHFAVNSIQVRLQNLCICSTAYWDFILNCMDFFFLFREVEKCNLKLSLFCVWLVGLVVFQI